MRGLTEFGMEFIQLGRGITRDAETALTRAREYMMDARGVLVVATTHLHARYNLPVVIGKFSAKYPDVSVQIEQGNVDDVARWVASRKVNVGITGLYRSMQPGLVTLPAMNAPRCIVVPCGHELLQIDKPTLADIARYRLVSYGALHPVGATFRELFRRNGIEPHIAISATDVTVLKELVAAGLGISILHQAALGPADVGKLSMIDAFHLIPPTTTYLLVRAGEHFRTYVYDFMESFAPQWTRRAIVSEMERQIARTATEEWSGNAPDAVLASVAVDPCPVSL